MQRQSKTSRELLEISDLFEEGVRWAATRRDKPCVDLYRAITDALRWGADDPRGLEFVHRIDDMRKELGLEGRV